MYKKVFNQKRRRFVWKFDVHIEQHGRIRDTIDDAGQSEAELKVYEAKLMQQLMKRGKASEPGSLSFGRYAAHYQAIAGKHAQTSLVRDMVRDIGRVPMSGAEDAFERFLKDAQSRQRRVSVGNGQTHEIGKALSQATIQGYKRYFKAICNEACRAPRSIRLPADLNPAAAVRVGKGQKRRRPILESERKRILEVVGNDFDWLLPALDFARTIPCRPGDQFFDFQDDAEFFRNVEARLPGMSWHFGLTIDKIDELHSMVEYLPQKTWKTEKMAKAVILPHMRDYIMSRIGDDECDTIFFRYGIKRLKQDTGRRYPIRGFRKTWSAILAAAECSGIEWYDWRHDAVNYLLSIGFRKDDIKRMAGWSSDDMVDWYDTEDKQRFALRTADILREAEQRHKQIYVAAGW
jgi:hypothetical protein